MFLQKSQQLPINVVKEGIIDTLHKPGDHVRGLRIIPTRAQNFAKCSMLLTWEVKIRLNCPWDTDDAEGAEDGW